MELCLIGKSIKEFRTRLHISQEELCDDICAVSSLSRIESGQQVPGRKLAEALFSRMGISAPLNDVPMTLSDFKRSSLEHQMIDMAAKGDYEFLSLLEDYKNCGSNMDVFEKQFFIFFSAIYSYRQGEESEKVLEKYIEALKLTLSSFSIDLPIKARLLTRTELMLMNNCALILHEMGQKEKAIRLMEYLKNHFEENFIDQEEKARSFPVVLFNLANWKGQMGFFEEALELSCKGIDVCVEYGKLFYFAEHIFNKAYSLAKLGRAEEAVEAFNSAFTVMEASKRAEMAKRLKNQVEEDFGSGFFGKN